MVTSTFTSSTSTTSASSPATPTGPKCREHGKPSTKMLCRNGDNKGRWFFKCSLPFGQQCRFFKWEDGNNNSMFRSGNAGNSAPGSSSMFSGASGPGGFTPKQPPQTLGGGNGAPTSSSSSTEASEASPSPSKRAPSTPSKRRRLSWEKEDAGHGSNTRSSVAPPTRSTPVPPMSQSAEEAIEDDIFDDIQDFDEIESGNAGTRGGPSNKGKTRETFTSFGGPAPSTPKKAQEANHGSNLLSTPPKPNINLAPGLPITPSSVGKQPNNATGAQSTDKWSEIINDPNSPFYARRNALLNSPASGQTSPLFSNSNPAPLTSLVPEGTAPTVTSADAPDTPSRHLAALLENFTTSSFAQLGSMNELKKQVVLMERQLKAANAKTAYHEKKESELRRELDDQKNMIGALKKENEVLRLSRMA